MTTATRREPSVAVARRALDALSAALGIETPRVARPGAVGLLPQPLLVRVADGWVHPGPPTGWRDFWVMVSAGFPRPSVTQPGITRDRSPSRT